MDEEDEEPFSASNADVVSTGPKQDELPKRPQPGGRFPSEVNLSRGLQAPLSPSSGSSGFEDRDVVAAAGTLPGSSMHQYGDTASSPTHAAYVDQSAREDGVNPYTSQRMSQDLGRGRSESQFPGGSAGGVAAAGLGGAAIGAIGSEAFHRHEDEKADEYRKQQEEQAAREAAVIAAPDTNEHQAAQEAAIYAVPDTDLAKAAPESSFMSGARSQGDVTTNGTASSDNPIQTALRPLTQVERPSLAAGNNHQSVQSVSQLHVPGEFPKDSKTKDTFNPI